MKVIKSLTLSNFKGHLNTDVDFHKGINCITGSSDAGKSTMLKSILWVLTNRPTGTGMVSFWNRDKKDNPINPTSAEIVVSGASITRIRSADRNGYDIETKEGKEELGAIGTDVPEKILDIMNMSDLNIAKQFDPPFLIGESPGEVARYLNRLIKLEDIDKASTVTEAKKRSTKKEITDLEKQLVSFTDVLVSTEWVVEARKVYDQYKELDEKHEEINASIEEMRDYRSRLAVLDRTLAKKSLLKKLTKAVEEITECSKEWNTCLDAIEDLKDARKDIASFQEVMKFPIAKAKKLTTEIAEIIPDVVTINVKIKELTAIGYSLKEGAKLLKYKPVVSKATRYVDEIIELEYTTHMIADKEESLRHISVILRNKRKEIAEYKDLLFREKATMPEECPTCGQTMKGVHTHE